MDLIERNALLSTLYRMEPPGFEKSITGIAAIKEIKKAHAVDAVPKSVYEQVKWERDIAIGQIESIGKSLGEKMDDIEPVRHGHWIKYEHGSGICCSECRHKRRYRDMYDNYCPNCGAKMDKVVINSGN